MLKLPNVTYVMVETLSHQMARIAMEDCLSKVEFGDVLLLTDKPELFGNYSNANAEVFIGETKARVKLVPNWPTKEEWCQANWFTVPPLIRTSHILFCQWDAGVWNTNMWREDFLNYDFIGAVWSWHPNKRVGNTGFCIKSTRLARYIYDRRGRFPCNTAIEDDLLCRGYRTDLENAGFTWAPERLAHEFAYEGCGPNPRPVLKTDHFGFHGAFNFARVFPLQEVERRANLMFGSEYVRNSYMMQSAKTAAPDVFEKIEAEANQAMPVLEPLPVKNGEEYLQHGVDFTNLNPDGSDFHIMNAIDEKVAGHEQSELHTGET
jgi:hypothetical protein